MYSNSDLNVTIVPPLDRSSRKHNIIVYFSKVSLMYSNCDLNVTIVSPLGRSQIGFAPIASLETGIFVATDPKQNFYHKFDRCTRNVIKTFFFLGGGGISSDPLLNAPFQGHFGVPIPSAVDLNYQTLCTRDVIQGISKTIGNSIKPQHLTPKDI